MVPAMMLRAVGLSVLSMVLYVAGYSIMPRGPMYRQVIAGWLIAVGWLILWEAWK